MTLVTRRATLTGAASAAAALALPRAASAQVGAGDPALLNLVLALDFLAEDLYRRAPDIDGLTAQQRALARSLRRDEREHIAAAVDLIGKMGGRPVGRLRLRDDVLRTGDDFLRAARLLEDTGVGLLNHVGARLEDPGVVALGGALANVEGRHAAAVRDASGEDPAPDAFDRPLMPDDARRRVAGLLR